MYYYYTLAVLSVNILQGLSGGQKRRLSIAIAMMGKPKLILLDEPTTYPIICTLTGHFYLIIESGLDPSNRRALWDIISKAKESHSIILSTHSVSTHKA